MIYFVPASGQDCLIYERMNLMTSGFKELMGQRITGIYFLYNS